MNDDKVKVLANKMMNEEDSMERTHMAMEISYLLDMEGTERGKFLFIPYMKDAWAEVDGEVWALHSHYDYAYTVYIRKDTLPENSVFL